MLENMNELELAVAVVDSPTPAPYKLDTIVKSIESGKLVVEERLRQPFHIASGVLGHALIENYTTWVEELCRSGGVELTKQDKYKLGEVQRILSVLGSGDVASLSGRSEVGEHRTVEQMLEVVRAVSEWE